MNEDSANATQIRYPYLPSWLDRLTGGVDLLPWPAAAIYLLVGLIAVGLFVVSDTLDGHRFLSAIHPFHIVVVIELIYAIALVHFLDREAARALERIKPLLVCDQNTYEVLRYRLTTIPAGAALLAGLAGLAVGLAAVVVERVAPPQAFAMFVAPGTSRYFIEAWLVLTWFAFGGLFYHTYHQLHLISHIYTSHTLIDIDRYSPLFNFSRVSGLTAIGLLVLPYGWYATVPGLIREPVGIVFGALFPAFAVISFISPLVGVHYLLVDAKEQALAENLQAHKSVRVELYQRTAARDLANINELRDTLAALREERQALEHISTWPWQRETLRNLIGVLILPVLLWLIQWGLNHLLQP